MTRSILIPPDNGTFANVPSLDYHADTASLSSSGARTILDSPAKFRYRMDAGSKDSRVFDFGKVAHTVVLGDGEAVEVIEADNWMTKAAKEAERDARAAGKVPILKKDMDTITTMAAVVWTHPLAGEILGAKGEAESSLYVDDPQTGVRLRARPDWMTPDYDPDRLWIADYKTTVTAKPQDFARKAADYGYHQQAAFYLLVARLLGLCDDPVFVFIAQEKEAPYLVSVVEFDAEAIAEGHRLNRQAIDLFKRCVDTGEWPGYDDGITPISLPPWAFKSKQTIGDMLAGN
jgi:hypothetical protein